MSFTSLKLIRVLTRSPNVHTVSFQLPSAKYLFCSNLIVGVLLYRKFLPWIYILRCIYLFECQERERILVVWSVVVSRSECQNLSLVCGCSLAITYQLNCHGNLNVIDFKQTASTLNVSAGELKTKHEGVISGNHISLVRFTPVFKSWKVGSCLRNGKQSHFLRFSSCIAINFVT